MAWKFYPIARNGYGAYGIGYCLSTDDKPTEGILNGSHAVEMDTSTVYFYDEENEEWLEWEG